MPPHRILFATDFSAGAGRALEEAADLAAAFAAPLVLLHVYLDAPVFDPEEPWPHRASDMASTRRSIEAALTEAADHARARRAPSVELALANGDIAPLIVQAAIDRDCDLIVLGAHRWRTFEDPTTVAEQVVRTARCGVLVAAAP